MQQILKYYWQMCLLRAGPDRLPASPFVLGLSFGCYFLVALATNLLSRDDLGAFQGVAYILIGVAVEAGVVGGLLAFKSVSERFLQGMAALLGANAVILVLTLPVSLVMREFDSPMLQALFESVFLVIFVWWLTIAGFILHRTADISLALGIAAAFGIEILAISTTYAVFPVETS